VFRREGGHVVVEYWLPPNNDLAGKLRLWASCSGECLATDFGLRLRLTCRSVRDSSNETTAERQSPEILDIQPNQDGTFLLVRPYSTAGHLYFRRTKWRKDRERRKR
jgi:hypothetical protein